MTKPKRIGLALGGGGAKGLAHIVMLEAFDELGLRPAALAGASFGAVIAALYASGLSAAEIRERVHELIPLRAGRWRPDLVRADLKNFTALLDPRLGAPGLLRGERFLARLCEIMRATRFEDLQTPLKIVAADFWRREEVVFAAGPLAVPLRASIALPWLFAPVVLGERVLIDGGTVNPVPYDHLRPGCHITIGIDVLGFRGARRRPTPSLFETVFNTFQIMEKSIMEQKLRGQPCDIYIRPEIIDIRVLEFFRAEEIYGQARPAKAELKRALEKLAR